MEEYILKIYEDIYELQELDLQAHNLQVVDNVHTCMSLRMILCTS